MSGLTRQHFRAFADAIAVSSAIRDERGCRTGEIDKEKAQQLVSIIAPVLRSFNGRFNWNRFEIAAGAREEPKPVRRSRRAHVNPPQPNL